MGEEEVDRSQGVYYRNNVAKGGGGEEEGIGDNLVTF